VALAFRERRDLGDSSVGEHAGVVAGAVDASLTHCHAGSVHCAESLRFLVLVARVVADLWRRKPR
jgi:hypothetical protein